MLVHIEKWNRSLCNQLPAPNTLCCAVIENQYLKYKNPCEVKCNHFNKLYIIAKTMWLCVLNGFSIHKTNQSNQSIPIGYITSMFCNVKILLNGPLLSLCKPLYDVFCGSGGGYVYWAFTSQGGSNAHYGGVL